MNTQNKTVLDEFAIAALQGEFATQRGADWINDNEKYRMTAKKCYDMANAMMEVRKNQFVNNHMCKGK